MDDRVGTLALRVRTDVVGRDHELRDTAEQLTRSVVERVSLLLEARSPGRVVILKTLPVRLALHEQQSESSALLREAADRAAEQIAQEIEASLPHAALELPRDAPSAVFANEAMFVASALLARARGEVAWFHAGALRDEPLERMVAHRELALGVLLQLARHDRLIDVVVTMQPAVASQLADVIGGTDVAPAARADDAAIVLALVERAATWPVMDRDVRRLATYACAYAAAERSGTPIALTDASRIIGWAERALAISNGTTPRGDTTASTTVRETGAHDTDDIATDTREIARDQITEYAGLFYLLPPILELGIADVLWQACLPEGAFVARSLRALLPDEDPALDVIAGAPIGIPPIDDAQVDEVATAVLGALVAALPRGGRAELHAGHVRLVEHATGRLLVVTTCDGPFVLFARPISSQDDARAALHTLTALWPSTVALHADPTLVELDRSGRLLHGAAPRVAPLLVAGETPAAVALGSIIAGAPCHVVVARVGDDVPDVSAWVAHRLARPARIVVAPELVEIRQPADAVDIELRSAGIDRDPGWVPWLSAKVQLRFED